ncbi:S-2-hydroxy-acid oxidase [Dactylonectria macrodidyma]|uniref:S-2-hydroxy-acid oxidase n=1 Tax=Dactylonectria macrodidyma TaxID=307937 RepID=A0A9P9IRY4_9HYPO|nr:S-2-hydroxy-acid oxidase [Dactylonectria macrodidyma]
MRSLNLLLFSSMSLAARPFLNEPDTGIEEALPLKNGSLPPLDRLLGLPDFDYVARHVMGPSEYGYVRHGAGSEGSYRNNLEAFSSFRFRPRVMVDITDIDASLNTSILGREFAAPFFISPFASAGLANEVAERGLVEAAGNHDLLYIASQTSSLSMEEIAASKRNASQVIWQQVSLSSLDSDSPRKLFKQIEKAGMKAIVLTVDSAGDRTGYRPRRLLPDTNISRDPRYTFMTWKYYKQLQKMTRLPIIPKGIQTVEDARKAIQIGAPAIFLSNHGARSVDGSPSPVEIAWEIYQKDPNIFKEIEVYADGGVRYGTDVLKLLALGVRAVGLGRPFFYANLYGTEGVDKAMTLLTREITSAGANIGLSDIQDIDPSYLTSNQWGI